MDNIETEQYNVKYTNAIEKTQTDLYGLVDIDYNKYNTYYWSCVLKKDAYVNGQLQSAGYRIEWKYTDTVSYIIEEA